MTNARVAKNAREKAAALRAEAAAKEARSRRIRIVAAVLSVLALAVAGGVIFKVAQDNKNAADAALNAPPKNVGTDGAFMVGKDTAKIRLDFYEDFQCPACKAFENAAGDQVATWIADGTVKVGYHTVSFLDRASTNAFSSRAAIASAAIMDTSPSSWPAFHKLVYQQQPGENTAGPENATLIAWAEQSGVAKGAIDAMVTAKKFEGWIKQRTDDWNKTQANPKNGDVSTPTIRVNGTYLDIGNDPLAALKAAVAKGGA